LQVSRNCLYGYIPLFIQELEEEFFTLKMSQEKEKENPQIQVLEQKLILFLKTKKYQKYVSDKFINHLKEMNTPWEQFIFRSKS